MEFAQKRHFANRRTRHAFVRIRYASAEAQLCIDLRLVKYYLNLVKIKYYLIAQMLRRLLLEFDLLECHHGATGAAGSLVDSAVGALADLAKLLVAALDDRRLDRRRRRQVSRASAARQQTQIQTGARVSHRGHALISYRGCTSVRVPFLNARGFPARPLSAQELPHTFNVASMQT